MYRKNSHVWRRTPTNLSPRTNTTDPHIQLRVIRRKAKKANGATRRPSACTFIGSTADYHLQKQIEKKTELNSNHSPLHLLDASRDFSCQPVFHAMNFDSHMTGTSCEKGLCSTVYKYIKSHKLPIQNVFGGRGLRVCSLFFSNLKRVFEQP